MRQRPATDPPTLLGILPGVSRVVGKALTSQVARADRPPGSCHGPLLPFQRLDPTMEGLLWGCSRCGTTSSHR